MAERPRKLSPESEHKLLEQLASIKAAFSPRPWDDMARPKQLPPDDPRHCLPDSNGYACGCNHVIPNWETWILMSGRGYGKTLAGANWVLKKGLSERCWIAVCAPTYGSIKDVCYDGPSGIISQALPGEIKQYKQNELLIELRNGSIIKGYTAEKPETIRGANLSYCWFDEIAFIKYDRFLDYGLIPALRRGKSQMMITTTPAPKKFLRKLLQEAQKHPDLVHFTGAKLFENPDEGIQNMGRKIEREKKGTLAYRQEVLGEWVEEAEGAFFTAQGFDEYRVSEFPEMRQVIVAVDPATTSSKDSDETGIVVAGEGADRHFYTLEDCSLRATPDVCMRAVVSAFHRWDCAVVVGEKNAVGDYMSNALYHVDPSVPFRTVQSMHGKFARATPVAAKMSNGEIHMVGMFEALEEQLCNMTPDSDRSIAHDDRADAWVHAMRYLGNFGNADYGWVYGFVPCRNCGQNVNETRDKQCRNCGAVVEVNAAPESYKSHQAVRWSNAYMRVCENGHEYPMRLKSCPKCKADPQQLIHDSVSMSGKNPSWHVYSNKNWFGRRI